MPAFTPPGRSGTSASALTRRTGRAAPGCVPSTWARCSAWTTGGRTASSPACTPAGSRNSIRGGHRPVRAAHAAPCGRFRRRASRIRPGSGADHCGGPALPAHGGHRRFLAGTRGLPRSSHAHRRHPRFRRGVHRRGRPCRSARAGRGLPPVRYRGHAQPGGDERRHPLPRPCAGVQILGTPGRGKLSLRQSLPAGAGA